MFSSLGFAGFLGCYTTFKPGKFSISYNVRGVDPKHGFEKNMLQVKLGYKKWPMLIREANLLYDRYEDA